MLTGNKVTASSRARDALPSPIRKLTPLADRARADGVSILHLNIGQPDLTAPQALMEGIQRYESPLLPYAPSQGITGTVNAWQRYYDTVGIHFETDQLLVTSGGSEAILFALMAVADPAMRSSVLSPPTPTTSALPS
jgi:aspartate aminotransferase